MTCWFVKRDTFSQWPDGSRSRSSIAFGSFPAQPERNKMYFNKILLITSGSRFLAVVIILGMALVLFSLFRYRGVDSGAPSWAILIAGNISMICTPALGTC